MHYKVQCQQISSFWQYLGKLRATLWPSSSWGWMLPEHWWWIQVWIQITPFSNSVCRASRGHVFFRFFHDLYIETLCLHPSWFREIIYMVTKGLPTKYCFMFNNYSFSLKRIFWTVGDMFTNSEALLATAASHTEVQHDVVFRNGAKCAMTCHLKKIW